jgi:Cft2 family RNA processing exonuclease
LIDQNASLIDKTNTKNNYIMGEINMEKKLIKEVYKINRAVDVLKSDKQRQKLANVLLESGITNEEVVEVTGFILENVSVEAFSKQVDNEAILSYIEAFTKVKEYMAIAKGYKEMGEVNKGISEEMNHLEEEGERLTDEMVGKNTQD